MESFEEYLKKKKIDPKKFKDFERGRYKEFEKVFSQIHPNSFTMQKLNMINFIRRKYPLVEELISKDDLQESNSGTSKIARPIFKKKV